MHKVLSMKAACDVTSLSRASIYRKIDPDDAAYYDETFPKPFPLSERKLNDKGILQTWRRFGFLEAEIEKWIADRVKKRTP